MSEQQIIVTVHAQESDPLLRHLNPMLLLRSLWRHRELVAQLSRREIVGRYRGSYLGIFWALLTPLMTLAVFSLVFGAMSAHPGGRVLDYPIRLFIGIIAFGVFSEVADRASLLVSSNPNFVKKAVFPLELLGVSAVAGAVVHSLMTLVIELAVILIAQGHIPATALLLPLVYIPLVLITLGVCWLLAGLGVFFRDLGNAVGPLVQLLFFLSPIIYSMKRFEEYPLTSKLLWMLNPFVTLVETARGLLIEGVMPDWRALGLVTAASMVIAMAGYAFFMKVRRYFADAM